MTPQEIDRKMAEFMGYKLCGLGQFYTENDQTKWIVFNSDSIHSPTGKCYPEDKVWSPSTNIAQAFQCAFKSELLITLQTYPDKTASCGMSEPYTNKCEPRRIFQPQFADTPAMAICLAILAAIEKGKP